MHRSLRPTVLLLALGAVFSTAQAQFGAQYQYFVADPMGLDLRDMDGDGAPDMVVSSRDGVDVLRNTGGPGLFASPSSVVNLEVLSWAVDVDNDLLPEIFGSQPDAPGLRMYRNNGNLDFSNAIEIQPVLRAVEMKGGDVDHDGDQDLILLTTNNWLVVFYNVDAAGQFSAPSYLGQVPGSEHLDLVDVDGDDAIDVVFSSSVTGSTYACMNVQGTIDSPIELTEAGTGVVRDLDNDGLADVLLVNGTNASVFWQRNLGNGAMGEMQMLDASFIGADRVRACDVDGDGDMDVIASSTFTQEIAWFENLDGSGNYGIRQTVAYSMPGINAIINSDVDNDGDEDVFVSSVDLDKVLWYTNLTNATGAVMGRVFNDINGDGIFNGNDHGLANMRVVCSDLGATYSNASGMYWFNVQNTNYAIALPPVAGWTNTTPDYYEITVPENGASQFNDFGLHVDAPVSELEPLLTSSPTRCNEDVLYWATVTNTGNQVADVHLMLTLDAYTQFQGSVPSPTETIGDAVIWVFPNVQPTHQRSVRLMATMPGTDMIGEPMADHLDAVAMLNGEVLSTNDFTKSFELECAYDPNDKRAQPEGLGDDHLTAMGTTLLYTIRFQNTGNATAYDVVLTDTLDAHLDPATLRVAGSSHANHVLVGDDGVVRFTFNDIMLPDSGTDMLASNGYVTFKIQHRAGLEIGTRVENTAAIYFDLNPAVITNTTWNTFGTIAMDVEETVAPLEDDGITVFPNPAQGSTTVRFGNAFKGRVQVDLLDATGRLIRTVNRRSDTVTISGSDLPSGLYFLRAVSDDGNGIVRTARVIFER